MSQQELNDSLKRNKINVNELVAQVERLRYMIEDLRCNGAIDQRWVSIAETHLQQGIMAAVRSIAQPQSF